MHIGERIQKLRVRKGMSVAQLARELDITVQELEAWEAGEQTPDTGKLLVLAAVLGTKAEYLQYGTVTQAKKHNELSGKAGSLLLVAAMVLYFIGVGTGEFHQQMVLFGLPLLNYGTSSLAVFLLAAACICLATGILCKVISRKQKD